MIVSIRLRVIHIFAASVLLASVVACGGGSGLSQVRPMVSPSPRPSHSATSTPTPVPTLAATEFGSAANYLPAGGLVAGPDLNLWLSELELGGGDAIAKITTAGMLTNYLIPNSQATTTIPLTVGPDAALWFVFRSNVAPYDVEMARMDTSGTLTAWVLPATDISISFIASGSDGNLWYVANNVDGAGNSALRAFSPATDAIVANLALPQSAYGTPGSLLTNPADGALLIATSGTPGGFLKVVPSAMPTVSFAYQAPAADTGTFGSLTIGGGSIWGLYTPPTGSSSAQQLVNVNESTYAVTYVALPTQYYCGSGLYCPLVFDGPIARGPDGNFYLWSNPVHAMQSIGIAAVSATGAILAFTHASYNPTDGAPNAGLIDGPDGNVWDASYDPLSNGNCCVYRVTPFGAPRAARNRH